MSTAKYKHCSYNTSELTYISHIIFFLFSFQRRKVYSLLLRSMIGFYQQLCITIEEETNYSQVVKSESTKELLLLKQRLESIICVLTTLHKGHIKCLTRGIKKFKFRVLKKGISWSTTGQHLRDQVLLCEGKHLVQQVQQKVQVLELAVRASIIIAHD